MRPLFRAEWTRIAADYNNGPFCYNRAFSQWAVLSWPTFLDREWSLFITCFCCRIWRK